MSDSLDTPDTGRAPEAPPPPGPRAEGRESAAVARFVAEVHRPAMRYALDLEQDRDRLRAEVGRLLAGLRVLEAEALAGYSRLAALHPGEMPPRVVGGLLDGLRTLLAPGNAPEAQEAPP